jgi:hypothetical protein
MLAEEINPHSGAILFGSARFSSQVATADFSDVQAFVVCVEQ